MKIKSLEIKNFRNYENEKINFCENVNIIYGNNAQGKTNILEGIYLFSLGKSNRTRHDLDLIKFEKEKTELLIDFISKGRETEGKIEINRLKRKKYILINDIPVKKSSELVGKLNVVYFGPEYLDLIKEGPKKRRKNIDILISQLRVKYFSSIYDLRKIIEQKNAVLKSFHPNTDMIDILNQKMIEASADIIFLRNDYIKKIENIAKQIQNEISEEKENLEIKYISCIGSLENDNISDIKKKLALVFEKNKKREIDYHECLVGPQRDDILFFINSYNAKSFASQGQQKTIILAEKIAEVELIREEIGEYPVFLLDDIMSELDEKRQNYIINKIKNMQILITCTDKERFNILNDVNFIHIDKGRLI